jgi:hypothetical protein
VLKRTLGGLLSKRELYNGNQEEWGNLFALNTDKSLLLYTISRRGMLKADVPAALREPEYQHLTLLRFRHPKEVEDWLRLLRQDGVDKGTSALDNGLTE